MKSKHTYIGKTVTLKFVDGKTVRGKITDIHFASAGEQLLKWVQVDGKGYTRKGNIANFILQP